MQDNLPLKLWPAGVAEVDDSDTLRQSDRSRGSTIRRAQSTPRLAPGSHLVLDLPAGDYKLRVYTGVTALKLPAGELTVLNLERGLGNAKLAVPDSPAAWREWLRSDRARHAFFAEPPSRGQPGVVPYFTD